MPIAILLFGILMLMTAIKGNQNAVATQLNKDFTGAGGNFFVWVGLIIMLGFIGRVLHIPNAMKLLIALIVLVYLFKQKGIFTQLDQGLTGTTAPAAASSNAVCSDTPVNTSGLAAILPQSAVGAAAPQTKGQ
jgi:hypothetical protein